MCSQRKFARRLPREPVVPRPVLVGAPRILRGLCVPSEREQGGWEVEWRAVGWWGRGAAYSHIPLVELTWRRTDTILDLGHACKMAQTKVKDTRPASPPR